MKINISGQNKCLVLAALFNGSKPLGMGMLHFDPAPMTEEQAEDLLAGGERFDYVQGRVMKVDLGGDELDPYMYDLDNGEGAALRALTENGLVTETAEGEK